MKLQSETDRIQVEFHFLGSCLGIAHWKTALWLHKPSFHLMGLCLHIKHLSDPLRTFFFKLRILSLMVIQNTKSEQP